jgi:hypothetical protein
MSNKYSPSIIVSSDLGSIISGMTVFEIGGLGLSLKKSIPIKNINTINNEAIKSNCNGFFLILNIPFLLNN